ncbi:MAG: GntR family transcriptional regulator [Armatimonadota bacterium]|nr:GntR family transcriptional regulator [Armatimonadota bacterium]
MPPNVRGRRPLYLDVADNLRSQITCGQYKPGDHLPPERELVVQFSCSRATIRLAVDRLIAQKLVERRPKRGVVVRSAQGEGEVDRPPKMDDTVSIVLPSASWHTNAMRVLRACQSALYQNSYYAIVCDSGYENLAEGMHREAEHVESMMAKGVPGMVLWPAHQQYDIEVFRRAQNAGLTIVLVDREIPGLECDYVGVDNADGAFQATLHLISHGHKRIGHITHLVQPTSLKLRIEGYRRALESAGLEYDDRLLIAAWPHQDTEQLETALRQMMCLQDPPTAVFCATDHLAGVTIAKLQYLGVMIPRDIAIVGFDDDLFAKWSVAPLTTVAQPFEAIGEEAVRLLMARLRHGLVGPPKRIILPTKLIIRQSCGSHIVRTS